MQPGTPSRYGPYERAWTIAADSSRGVWAATGGGIVHMVGDAGVLYDEAGGSLIGTRVWAIAIDSRARVWVGTEKALCMYDSTGGWTQWPVPPGSPLATFGVENIAFAADSSVWITSGSLVYRFVSGTWTDMTPPGSNVGPFTSIVFDERPHLWVGGDHGLWRHDGRQWSHYDTSNGLTSLPILDLCVDRDGALWIACVEGGVLRYDGVGHRVLRSPEDLPLGYFTSSARDSTGGFWFGTSPPRASGTLGVTRIDPATFACTTYGLADSLPSVFVQTLATSPSGTLWAGTNRGAASFNGVHWHAIGQHEGWERNSDDIRDICFASDGSIWLATWNGAVRWKDAARDTFTVSSTNFGLPGDQVNGLCEDLDGDMWFATYATDFYHPNALARLDQAGQWSNLTPPLISNGSLLRSVRTSWDGTLWMGGEYAGLVGYRDGQWTQPSGIYLGTHVGSLVEDRRGHAWFPTFGDLVRYADGEWGALTQIDGLSSPYTTCILEDPVTGALWVGTNSADQPLSVLQPDIVAPYALLTARPPRASIERRLTVSAQVVFHEISSLFSFRLDDEGWTPWNSVASFSRDGLDDGPHRIRVRARDPIGNVSRFPDSFDFIVDATPPAPVLTAPASGAIVRDSLRVYGSTLDERFRFARLEARRRGASGPWIALADTAHAPAHNALLATFDSRALADGEYDLRLAVTDTLGLVGVTTTRVVVDNAFPPAELSSPVRVLASLGGIVWAVDRKASLLLSPGALAEDATVIVAPAALALPDALPGGAPRWSRGDSIGWFVLSPDSAALPVRVRKPLRLDLDCAACVGHPTAGAVYRRDADAPEGWRRLGGTFDPAAHALAVTVDAPGVYAVFGDATVPANRGGITELHAAPRVLAPRNGPGSAAIQIRFALPRPAPVTVRIFNLAGRQVRVLARSTPMSAGLNVVAWDGRTDAGDAAPNDLYLVSVDADGDHRTLSVSIAR
jgi:ligand-binding sensor domain-containing protein